MKKIEYVLYKGDNPIDFGTKEELAKRHNCSPNTIQFLSYPSSIKREKEKNRKISVKVVIEDMSKTSLNGEIISIETLDKMSKTEKDLEKARRKINLLELENKTLTAKNGKLEEKNKKLEFDSKLVKEIEMYLTVRIEHIKQKNPEQIICIGELSKLSQLIQKSYENKENYEENEEG